MRQRKPERNSGAIRAREYDSPVAGVTAWKGQLSQSRDSCLGTDSMTDLEKILIGAVVALIGALALALIRWGASRVSKRLEDQPRVDIKLSFTSHADILHQVGCPCILVRIIGASERPTRLTAVEASLVVDNEFIDAFEKGFGIPFSQGMSPELPPPRFYLELLRVGASEAPVVKLERDDVAEFLLPVPFTPYEHFIRAPSQNVEIAMRTTDGERKVLTRGREIQEMIRAIVDMQGDRLRSPHVTMTMGITVSSKELPQNLDGVGKVNPNAIDIPRPEE